MLRQTLDHKFHVANLLPASLLQIGDIVELVEGYENYGDASRGPMVTGDRGQVVEVQQGSNGER